MSKKGFIELETKYLVKANWNYKKGDREQEKRLIENIKKNGFIENLIVRELEKDKYEVVNGNHRLKVLQELNIKTVMCFNLGNISDTDAKRIAIETNETRFGSNKDKLNDLLKEITNEFDSSDLISTMPVEISGLGNVDEILKELDTDYKEKEKNGDEIPEIDYENTITKKGDIWILGEHRVMCGDSTNEIDVKLLLDGKSIDMVFTDPPYGVSYADKNVFLNNLDKGNKVQIPIKNDHMTLDNTGLLWENTFKVWTNYLASYSSYYICSPQGGDLFLMMMMMNKNGFPLRHCLIWNKNNHVIGRCDYFYKHEPILYGWKHRHKFYNRGQFNKSVWDISKPNRNDLHPTMKPVQLVENAILNSTEKNMLVADCFLGSGSTLIACEKTNRICYGMEIDEYYCDVIVKRYIDYIDNNDNIFVLRDGKKISYEVLING